MNETDAAVPPRTEPARPQGAERTRLAAAGTAWREFGPYLAERAWGTVREDYSANGDAWEYFPFDHARSRTYRWSEDGLGGVCDDAQLLCFAFAFWNGRDPILKERIFGLSGPQGNHGEDAKEYWWYLDSTPTHSFMRWRYLYPQAAFPYADLLAENARRGRLDPEYELVDTGILDDDRYFEVTADYAKASPDDYCVRVSVRNAGPDEAPLHVLPTLWCRNTWSWGDVAEPPPVITAAGGALRASVPRLGTVDLSGDGEPELLFCENESNVEGLWGAPGGPPYPKDGIGDHVVSGSATVNPAGTGTKAALWYRLSVPAGGTATIALRLARAKDGKRPAKAGTKKWSRALEAREQEADEFYAGVVPSAASPEEASIARQAFAGMLWTKQFYHYDVERWLAGDPGQPVPPASRRSGRNAGWWHLDNHDVISIPDSWEYPWYASWDLAFHCVTLAHVSPAFAKAQLRTICREWYMHPDGQLPAYEWDFGDVNPPVQAWAALRVFEIDGGGDYEFLERIFQKLLLNFTWWVNQKDAAGNNVFEGGFLGLDNIGPIDRSAHLPVDGLLEQADGTSWMAMYCLNMLEIALVLARYDDVYEDMAVKFFEHFCYIGDAVYSQGLYDEEDGFFYDLLRFSGGDSVPLRVRSAVGLLPLCATATLDVATLHELPFFAEHFEWFVANRADHAGAVVRPSEGGSEVCHLLSIVAPDRLGRLLSYVLDEAEFLSDHGLRALSRVHKEHPFSIELAGTVDTVDYEPAESTTPLFGGNSNWRGPVWFPINFIVIGALRRFHRFLGDGFTVECPTGSGRRVTLEEAADEISRRLVSVFLDDARRAPPRLRRLREIPDRPRSARPHPVPRILQRGHGGGPRRLPPNGLDRARRQPHPHPAAPPGLTLPRPPTREFSGRPAGTQVLGEGAPPGDAELQVDPLQVVVHRAGGDEEPLGDLAAREAVGGEQRHLLLAGGEVGSHAGRGEDGGAGSFAATSQPLGAGGRSRRPAVQERGGGETRLGSSGLGGVQERPARLEAVRRLGTEGDIGEPQGAGEQETGRREIPVDQSLQILQAPAGGGVAAHAEEVVEHGGGRGMLSPAGGELGGVPEGGAGGGRDPRRRARPTPVRGRCGRRTSAWSSIPSRKAPPRPPRPPGRSSDLPSARWRGRCRRGTSGRPDDRVLRRWAPPPGRGDRP